MLRNSSFETRGWSDLEHRADVSRALLCKCYEALPKSASDCQDPLRLL